MSILKVKQGNQWVGIPTIKGEANATMLAPEYKDLTYPVEHGQLCVYDGVLYTANQDIQATELWTAAHWTQTSIQEELDAKADKTDTVLNTTLSRGRKEGTTVGLNSFAFGYDVEASGKVSFAEGYGTVASASRSHAEGWESIASGNYSHAEGEKTHATGTSSHSEGKSTYANGSYSHAQGLNSIANGEVSNVFGANNVEDNYNNWPEWVNGNSYSVGDKVKYTSNNMSYGYISKVDNNTALLNDASSWMNRGKQMNYVEIVGNGYSISDRSNARALDWDGNEYLAGDVYVHTNSDSTGGEKLLAAGDLPIEKGTGAGSLKTKDYSKTSYSTTYNYSQTASGEYAVAFGLNTSSTGMCSFAEGAQTTSSGTASHSEGYITSATGADSHAEGSNAVASGMYSHAEGYTTTASGAAAHSQGWQTTASAEDSFAAGAYTTANTFAMTALGSRNVSAAETSSYPEWVSGTTYAVGDKVHYTPYGGNYECTTANSDSGQFINMMKWRKMVESSDTLFVVGNGLNQYSRYDGNNQLEIVDPPASNAFKVDWTGEGRFNGDVYVNCNSDSTGGYKVAKDSDVAIVPGTGAGSAKTRAYEVSGHTFTNIASGRSSFAEGDETIASGAASHTEGDTTRADKTGAHAEGKGAYFTIRLTGNANATTYQFASLTDIYEERIVVGSLLYPIDSETHAPTKTETRTITSVDHANNTITVSSTFGNALSNTQIYLISAAGSNGTYSHTEGASCIATGSSAHAEGSFTVAYGSSSHTEGSCTKSSGIAAHAEGEYTIAAGRTSHVFGRYNIADDFNSLSEWVANTSYAKGDKVKVTTIVDGVSVVNGYSCVIANSDAEFTSYKWSDVFLTHVEIVGNGTSDARSNARTLDWNGNERLMGDVYVGCNADSTGGTKLASMTDLAALQSNLTMPVIEVTGSTPSITADPNCRYICGEVSSVSFTPAASGISNIRFTSGSSVALLTVPNTVIFPSWFDKTDLDTNTIYEITVQDGVYGAVMTWPTA